MASAAPIPFDGALVAGKLPAETRNQIYELVFHDSNGLHFDYRTNPPSIEPSQMFALAEACKMFRHECKALPYLLNTVHHHIPVLSILHSRHERSEQDACLSNKRNPNPTLQDLVTRTQNFVVAAQHSDLVEEIIARCRNNLLCNAYLDTSPEVRLYLGHGTIQSFPVAWKRVASLLHMFSPRTQMRVLFGLRVSSKRTLAYDFGLDYGARTIVELSGNFPELSVEFSTTGLSPSEIATIQEVHRLVLTIFHSI